MQELGMLSCVRIGDHLSSSGDDPSWKGSASYRRKYLRFLMGFLRFHNQIHYTKNNLHWFWFTDFCEGFIFLEPGHPWILCQHPILESITCYLHFSGWTPCETSKTQMLHAVNIYIHFPLSVTFFHLSCRQIVHTWSIWETVKWDSFLGVE